MESSHETEQQQEGDRPRSVWTVLFVVSILALIAVVSFGSGIVAERFIIRGPWPGTAGFGASVATNGDPETDAAFPRQAEVRDILEDEYFFLPASPEARATFIADLEHGAIEGMAIAAATPVASLDDYRRELDFGAARGMTEALSDDYTVFLEPLRGAPLREELAGEYEGIGIWVEHPEGQFTIVAPIAGSPAARADLRAGDVIVAADGRDLGELETDAAMSLIRGPRGSSVVLTIRRPGVPETFDVTLNREAIEIPAVVYEPEADGKIARITVAIFGDNTTRELDAALKRAKDESVTGIVLDLRGNGGGWVTSAQEMLGRFIPEDAGPALYQDLDLEDDDDLISEPILGGGETAFDIPLVVLMDGGTASASEIVAGAIRDYERGTLVGGPSFGKGLVQRVHDFEDGSSARVTFARWLTPDRHPIPEDGLSPDITVTNDPDINSDRQLETAVGVALGTLVGTPVATQEAQ
jgi:carboxyl-terminal processing protease